MSANFFKAFACSVVAGLMTAAVGWTFVDTTSVVHWDNPTAAVTQLATTVASALVR
ncbi:MAG: hypothetical protein IPG25_03010 [Proteobacteria bacterium]|nr:hypothetical protein [Pseudomonadota bacterium]